jgi:hypothetical protein
MGLQQAQAKREIPIAEIVRLIDLVNYHEEHLLRGADDPNDVVLLFKASSLDRARAFMANPSVGEAIEKSGVWVSQTSIS